MRDTESNREGPVAFEGGRHSGGGPLAQAFPGDDQNFIDVLPRRATDLRWRSDPGADFTPTGLQPCSRTPLAGWHLFAPGAASVQLESKSRTEQLTTDILARGGARPLDTRRRGGQVRAVTIPSDGWRWPLRTPSKLLRLSWSNFTPWPLHAQPLLWLWRVLGSPDGC